MYAFAFMWIAAVIMLFMIVSSMFDNKIAWFVIKFWDEFATAFSIFLFAAFVCYYYGV